LSSFVKVLFTLSNKISYGEQIAHQLSCQNFLARARGRWTL